MTLEQYLGLLFGGLAIAVGVVTFIIVWVQLSVMNRQQETMDTQLRIMEKQDALLARTATLTMEIELDKNGPPRLVFSAKNGGNRSAQAFYWQVYVPIGLLAQPASFSAGGAVTFGEPVGADMIAFGSFHQHPVYPSRRVVIGSIKLAHPLPNGPAGSFLWQLTSEDGVFPDVGTYQVHDAIFPSAESPVEGARWRFDPTSTAKVTHVEQPEE